MAMMARIATTAPRSLIESERATGRIVAGSPATTVEEMPLRPQQRRHHRADDAELEEPLAEIDERLAREQPREARDRRNPRQLRYDLLGGEQEPMLHDIAGKGGDAKEHKRNADGGGDLEAERLEQREQRRTVGRNLVGLGEETAERGLQAHRHGAGEHHDQERSAGDHEPGIDLEALDDVAAAQRLFQAPGRRVFCAFV
jgi:hypothetical protein